MIQVANNTGIPVIVRIPRLDDIPILVDFGADGIMVPVVTLERAKEAIERSKYKPIGNRSLFGSFRAHRISGLSLKDYYQKANDHISLIVQIENLQGMSDIDEILNLEGVDIVTSGRNDISQSLGFPYDASHPKVLEFEDIVIKKSLHYGKIPAMDVQTKNDLIAMKAKGVHMVFSGRDEKFLLNAIRNNLMSLKE
jgi:2-keto-3-deoxy-L-rhamnonate aldolase RhmA